MEEMKMDKTGACTVIARRSHRRPSRPGDPAPGVARVENMPGPHSARPGDVVKAMNGKDGHILNTGRQGRLIWRPLCYPRSWRRTSWTRHADRRGGAALGDQDPAHSHPQPGTTGLPRPANAAPSATGTADDRGVPARLDSLCRLTKTGSAKAG